MTLIDGANLFQAGINITKTSIPQWNGITIYSLCIDLAFLGILMWFIARIIKGKSHSEPVSSELIPPDMSDHESVMNSFYDDGRQTDEWTNSRGELGYQTQFSETGIDHAHEYTSDEARIDIERENMENY